MKNEEFNYDEIAKEYNELMRKSFGDDHEKYARYKVDLCADLIREKPKVILNYGCGIGRDMDLLMGSFANDKSPIKMFGCDISAESIIYAKNHSRYSSDITWFHSDTPDSLYKQGVKFDLVFIACVFHHIKPNSRLTWVRAIEDNMAKGGYICVFEHNMINPYTNRIVKHPKVDPQDNPEWMLKKREIENLLKANNDMQIYWSGYTLFSPIRKPWIIKLEEKIKWLPFGAQQCVIGKKE